MKAKWKRKIDNLDYRTSGLPHKLIQLRNDINGQAAIIAELIHKVGEIEKVLKIDFQE